MVTAGALVARLVTSRDGAGSSVSHTPREESWVHVFQRLFPALDEPPSGTTALRFADRALTYAELAGVVGSLAAQLRHDTAQANPARVAVWATPTVETSVGVLAALLAGIPAVPINPKIGARELEHIVSDSAPTSVLTDRETTLPEALSAVPRVTIDLASDASPLPAETSPEAPALIIYTSGTTGPPKGVVLPRRAIASTLDALAQAWQWTAEDVLVHALPLFHVHGLILGILGPLRRGGTVEHLGTFAIDALTARLRAGGTMVFGVPTMYHRIAETIGNDRALADALAGARLLVSGSAPLPVTDHERITRASGAQVIERYGMTETLINTSARVDRPHKPGTVGLPLRGVDARLVDESDTPITGADTETVGEIQVRGPNLFTEYLNRPEATAEVFVDGWFRTGDMAIRDADGDLRIVGRKATDLIKSGGYKIGAGEIENALLEHPTVAEAAVTGEPDPDLGETIVAWIVPRGTRPGAEDLINHVASQLSPHKRPRAVHFVESLPRNEMGKVLKRSLYG